MVVRVWVVVFWVVAPCSLVVYKHFGGTPCLRNVGIQQQKDYTEQQLRIPHS
jgi:hypothetical protein